MIQIFEFYFDEQAQLDWFKGELKKELGDNYQQDYFSLYCSFLDDMFRRSMLLQESLVNTVSNDLISCVDLPWDMSDDFDGIQFSLRTKSGRAVKRREEFMFKSLCDKYFKDSVGLKSLFNGYFE